MNIKLHNRVSGHRDRKMIEILIAIYLKIFVPSMSDRVEKFAVPVDFVLDFELPNFSKLAASGASYTRVKVSVPFPVLRYVYLKYMAGHSTT